MASISSAIGGTNGDNFESRRATHCNRRTSANNTAGQLRDSTADAGGSGGSAALQHLLAKFEQLEQEQTRHTIEMVTTSSAGLNAYDLAFSIYFVALLLGARG